MKKLFLSLIVLATVATACKDNKKDAIETKEAKVVDVNVSNLNNVDLEASTLAWKGTKPGGAHNGILDLKSGGMLVNDGALVGGEFVFDMTTIDAEDLEGEKAASLEGHLKSADFFDVEKYPTSKFVITKVEGKNEDITITGNLTLKETTKSITIPAKLMNADGVTTVKSEPFNINRADFNVRYGSKSFFDDLKDKFIDDLVEISFEVKTKA